MKNKVIAIVGATASGKTSYSIDLAKQINGEIVSADSRLVYKDFGVGVAKPTVAERQGIAHYMIDIVAPTVNYSAGLYAKEAKKCIDDILLRGKTPIVVGGTGLYLRILLENYDLPEIEPNWNLREELAKLPYDELEKMLYSLDSEAFVEKNDKKKIIRYIEIIKSTGKSLAQSRGVSDIEYDVEWVGVNFPREELYKRIDNRVDLMIKDGLVDETKMLLAKYGRVPNVVDTIGYREMILALDGVISLDEAIEKLKQNTRNYAKRQLTWFRKNENIKWNCYPERKKK